MKRHGVAAQCLCDVQPFRFLDVLGEEVHGFLGFKRIELMRRPTICKLNGRFGKNDDLKFC